VFRWLRRLVVTLVLLALIVSAPIVWIEKGCAASPELSASPRAPLVSDRDYPRRESDSYLSFPEWHIVYAYEDLAGVLQRGNESEFAYGRQIVDFWRSLCRLTGVVTERERVATDTKVMLYTIGWSFTAELALKGAYEKTVGRLFEWWRGPDKTAEDEFIARDMQAYAVFLHQTPWYAYPFATRLTDLWRSTPWHGERLPRKIERRGLLTTEYGVKAIYGAAIGYASNTALGAADQEILTVVSGLDATDAAQEPSLKVVRVLGGGRTLVRTPRYQAYTDLLVRLARRGRNVVEIAGNQRILVTVLAPPGYLPRLGGVDELFEAPLQSRRDRRRMGLDVAVPQLAATIRALEKVGVSIEHIYDY
jgi:hypothetical protein